jgi:hypothetical protein
MNVSIDISYYPLTEAFVPPILDFISRLNQYTEIKVVTSGLSTQVFGSYDDAMRIVSAEMKISCELPHSVFVLKIVNSDRQHYYGNR